MGFRAYQNESIRLRSPAHGLLEPYIAFAVASVKRLRNQKNKLSLCSSCILFISLAIVLSILAFICWILGPGDICSCKALWKPFKKGTSFGFSGTCLRTLPTSGPLLTIRTPNSTMKGSKSRFCARNAACCRSGDAMMYIFDVNIGSV
jgi:hypothetical protein